MELYSSFALLTSLALPASSQDISMGSTHHCTVQMVLSKLVG